VQNLSTAIAVSGRVTLGGFEARPRPTFRSLLGSTTTGVEAMLTGRFEHQNHNGSLTRFKLGVGEGLHSEFGTSEWRCVFAMELVGRVR
jgi:hypothetical protein